MRLFLSWLGPEATREGLSSLAPERIERFFLNYAETVGRSARRSMQSALRTFFRYCLQQGHTCQRLDEAIPTLRWTAKFPCAPTPIPERGLF